MGGGKGTAQGFLSHLEEGKGLGGKIRGSRCVFGDSGSGDATVEGKFFASHRRGRIRGGRERFFRLRNWLMPEVSG